MHQGQHGRKWYLDEVKKYAGVINRRGIISVSVETREITLPTENGFYEVIQFRDVNSDEKLNLTLERISCICAESQRVQIEREIRYFCRDGLMVGMHKKFPRLFDED